MKTLTPQEIVEKYPKEVILLAAKLIQAVEGGRIHDSLGNDQRILEGQKS